MIQFYQPVIEMSLQGASTLAGVVDEGQWALTVCGLQKSRKKTNVKYIIIHLSF